MSSSENIVMNTLSSLASMDVQYVGKQLLSVERAVVTPVPPHSQLPLEENFIQLGWISVFSVLQMMSVFLFSHFLKQSKYSKYFPDSNVAIVSGAIVGLLVWLLDREQVAPSDGSMSPFVFRPKMFFFIFLPPIIMEAGYSLQKRHFFNNIGVVQLYAGPGVIISTLVIGIGSYLCSLVHLLGPQPFRLIDALLFGSLLSVTDSVATISILGSPDLNFDSSLYSIVFGESVVNDAVGILIFDTLSKFSTSTDILSLSELSIELQLVFVGSIILGIVIGLLCSFMFRKLDFSNHPTLEFLMLSQTAYLAYVLAIVMQLSGVMALFICSVTLRHYNFHNLSDPAKTATTFGFKAISHFCEMVVFVYLGITFVFSLTPSFHLNWSLSACCVAFALVWIGRAAYIYPLSWVANLYRQQPLTLPMQTIIYCGGLRGAVSFALALNVHGKASGTIITSTLSVVIITSVLGGSFMEKIVRFLSKLNNPQTEANHTWDDLEGGNSKSGYLDSNEHTQNIEEDPLFIQNIAQNIALSLDTTPTTPAPAIPAVDPALDPFHRLEQEGELMQTSVVNKVIAQVQWGNQNDVWETFDNGVMKNIFGGDNSQSVTNQ